MNINTSTLLNTLMSKVDTTIKAKIEKLSVDGKVDLTSLSKDKGIQSLLSELFKDISTGAKTKTEVVTLLENSKQSVKFKDISTDVKQIITSLNSELENEPEVKKLTSSLKNSLVDIKNLDEKILKSTFQNNGILLESKISKSTISVSNNLEKLLGQLNANVKVLSNLEKIISPEIKNDISNVKNASVLTEVKEQKNATLTTPVQDNSKIEKTITTSGESTSLSNSKIEKIIATSTELTPNNKLEIQNIIGKINSFSTVNEHSKIENSLNNLDEIVMQIDKIELKSVTPTIKNEIVLNLKELAQQAKNNILNTNSLNINKSISVILDQVENLKSDNLDEIKTEIKKLETQIKTLNNEKTHEVKTLLHKEIISDTSKILDTIKNGNLPDLLKNNISNMKNVSSDVKNIMLQMKEIIEEPNNSETVSKELKTSVDKVISQINYYQLSSYSSNSNHGYLSFLQDELNDADIKFNNANNEEFSCLIHLSLKEKGDLKILLQLDNSKNLNINIGVEQEEFKETIQNTLQKLRVQINSLGLSVVNLNIFDLGEDLNKSDELKAYGNNTNLDFGIDIKV